MNPTAMLRELLQAEPFRPFYVCISDGRKLKVPHPDFLIITPHGRIIWEESGDPDAFAITMPFHVTGIESVTTSA